MLLDIGTYVVQFALYVFREPPIEVRALLGRKYVSGLRSFEIL